MHTLEAVRKYEKEYEVDADKRPLFHVTPPIGSNFLASFNK